MVAQYPAIAPIQLPAEESRIVNFAKKWRAKRFCTPPYIRAELKLKCSPRTVARCLNRHGYHWRPVLKKLKLKKTELASRKVFVDKNKNARKRTTHKNKNAKQTPFGKRRTRPSRVPLCIRGRYCRFPSYFVLLCARANSLLATQ